MVRFVTPNFVHHTAKAEGFDRPLGRSIRKPRLSRSRLLAGMLLALAVAALMAVADQLIKTWADGHLLAVWVGLWAIAFTALALLAPPLRQLTGTVANRMTCWNATRKQQRSDDALWAGAQLDYRVMRDLQCAKMRADAEA